MTAGPAKVCRTPGRPGPEPSQLPPPRRSQSVSLGTSTPRRRLRAPFATPAVGRAPLLARAPQAPWAEAAAAAAVVPSPRRRAPRPSAQAGRAREAGLLHSFWAVQLDPATQVAGGGASGGNVSGTSLGAGSLMTSGPGAGMSGGPPGVGASSGVGGRTGFGIVSGGGVGTGFGGSLGIRRLRGLRSQDATPRRGA
jgi:hypothetical protein